jgi:hypothetical protein
MTCKKRRRALLPQCRFLAAIRNKIVTITPTTHFLLRLWPKLLSIQTNRKRLFVTASPTTKGAFKPFFVGRNVTHHFIRGAMLRYGAVACAGG